MSNTKTSSSETLFSTLRKKFLNDDKGPALGDKNNLFVYGTLRVNRGLPHILKGAYILHKFKRVPGYRMYSCGSYPTVVPTSQGMFSIEGDIVQVSADKLLEIDAYEELETGEYTRIWDEKNAFWIYVQGSQPGKIFFPIDTGIWIG